MTTTEAWNLALATGDRAIIEATKTAILNGIFTKIMDEDINYHVAGWASS